MTPPAQEPSPGAAGAQGAALGALAASPAFVQAVPPAVADAAVLKAAQEGAEAIVQGFLRFFRRSRSGQAQRLYDAARAEAPGEPDDLLRKLVRDEMDREAEFQRKMIERLRRDLPIALRISDPNVRKDKVQMIVARERRYIDAREQAMGERIMGALSMQALKRVSPEGAFWTLSPLVKNHTLDCVVLSGQFWPWAVLDELHPPLHHGCACELISKQDALAQGLMTADQVPDTKDAVRRAMRLYQRAKALEQSAEPEEITGYMTWLQEGYDLRYPAGTEKGGEFRPKHGYAPGLRKVVHKALHGLVPHRPETPVQGRENQRGTQRWLAGHRVFVPTHRHFERRFGADTYHSPPGSNIVYRNGDEFTGPDKVSRPLVLPGKEDPGTLRRVTAAIDSLAVPTQDKKRPPGDAPLLDHQWNNWDEFTSETHGIADALGRQFSASVQHGGVNTDPARYDHSGQTDWQGNIRFGADVEPNVLNEAERLYGDNAVSPPSDEELAATYNTYRVQAHEAVHTVNPARKSDYATAGGAVLEEGLSEEIAHALLQINLQRHGRQDVLEWAAANPNSSEVEGTYRKYRAAIQHSFDEMGVPAQDRLGLMLHLKFQAFPGDRIDEMSRIAYHYKGANAPNAAQITRTLTAAYDAEKYKPTIAGDTGTPVSLVRTTERQAGKPVYGVGRLRIYWHAPLRGEGFGTQGWVVYDPKDPYENPSSPRFDPIYTSHPTLKAAEYEARRRLGFETSKADAGTFDEHAWKRLAAGEYEHPSGWKISRINYGYGDEWTARNDNTGAVQDPLPTLARAKEAAALGFRDDAALGKADPGTLSDLSTSQRKALDVLAERASDPMYKGRLFSTSGSGVSSKAVEALEKQGLVTLERKRGGVRYGHDAIGPTRSNTPDTWEARLTDKGRSLMGLPPEGKADPGTFKVPDLQAFGKAFDGFEHGGLTAKVNWDDSEAWTANAGDSNLRTAEGAIYDGKAVVGSFRRYFTLDHGVPTVEHDRLRLNPSYRGHGFATAFNRHAFAEYKKMGVKRVTVHTADVGSYAWARTGFHFTGNPRQSIALLKDSNNWAIDVPWDELPPGVADGFDAFLKTARSEYEIAGWGRGKYEWNTPLDENMQRTKMWPGKAFLLGARFGWHGYLDLDEIQESEMSDVFAVWDRMAADGTLHVTPDDISGDDDEAFWNALT